MRDIVVGGGSGAIDAAFAAELARKYPNACISSLSRTGSRSSDVRIRTVRVDYLDEASLRNASERVGQYGPVDLVIAAGGILHQSGMMPEKSLRDLSADKLLTLYSANTVGPALMAKHFPPLMSRGRRAVFAALSARVGGISDNRLGGWYSYRASKAALNMIIRSASIEMGRRNPQAVVVGLHPGTVDSALSRPFQGNVGPDKLFSPQFAVIRMLEVLESLKTSDSRHCYAWDGSRIEP